MPVGLVLALALATEPRCLAFRSAALGMTTDEARAAMPEAEAFMGGLGLVARGVLPGLDGAEHMRFTADHLDRITLLLPATGKGAAERAGRDFAALEAALEAEHGKPTEGGCSAGACSYLWRGDDCVIVHRLGRSGALQAHAVIFATRAVYEAEQARW